MAANNATTRGTPLLWSMFLAVIICLLLTLGVFLQMRRMAMESLHRDFSNHADLLTAIIENRIATCVHISESLPELLGVTESVNHREFAAASATLLADRQELSAIGWAPRVKRADRGRFEADGRRELAPAFQTLEKDRNGRLIRAGERSFYYPVFYSERKKGEVLLPEGFDLGSDPQKLRALEQACDGGRPIARERLSMVTGAAPGFAVIVPVYASGARVGTVEERRSALKGLVLAVYRADTLLSTSLEGTESLGIDLELRDLSAPSTQALLYRWTLPEKKTKALNKDLDHAPLNAAHAFRVTDREWAVQLAARRDYMEHNFPRGHYLVLLGGALLAGLVGLYLRSILSRRGELERLVLERTAKLRQSERRFRQAVAATSDGLWEWDLRNEIGYMSPAYFRMLGHRPHEFAMTQQEWLIRVHPDDRELALKTADDCVENRTKGFEAEYRMQMKSGEWKWVFARGKALRRDENGRALELIGTLVDIAGRKRMEDALYFLAQRGWRDSGADFFPSLAAYLATTLKMDYAFIGRLEKDGETIQTLALYSRGAIVPNIEYSLRGSPCENVVGKELCCYREGVQQMFATDDLLKTLGAVSYTAIPLWDSQGKAIGLVAMIGCEPLADASLAESLLQLVAIRAAGELERRDTEEALRNSEERFRALAENISDCIWEADPNYIFTYVNPNSEHLLGYKAAEVVGKPVTCLMPPEEALRVKDLLDVFFGTRVPFRNIENVNRHRDGHLVVMEASGVPVFDEKCEFLGYRGISRDITERKRTEISIQEEEERFRALAENTSDWVWEVNADMVYVYASPKITELLGYEVEEVLGKSPFAFMPPEEADRVRELMGPVATAREPIKNLENTNLHKDGHPVVLETSGVPVFDAAGEFCGYRGIDRDISVRKETEDSLRRTASELARSNRDLEHFAYVASHDLQEPLRTVISHLQLLQRNYGGKLGSDADDFIWFAVDAATRMKNLISDLLAYSRAGKSSTQLGPVDMLSVLNQVTKDLEPVIVEGGVEITHDDLPTVWGDRVQMVQLLQNLISNSVKFRSTTSPRIHVGAREEPDDWLLWVKDNGIGIEPQYVEKIFEIFQRLHGQGEYPGTGIGLAICKRIVEMRGGRIWAESEHGKGTTFSIIIPKANR